MSKVYLITGAGHFPGIGSCLAEYLLHTDQCVVINSRSFDQKWSDLKKSYPNNLRIVEGDITDSQIQDKFIKTAIDSWNRIDTLVNNAGKVTTNPPDRNEWAEEFLLSVTVPYELSVKSAEYLKSANGSIIMIGSRSGIQVAQKNTNNDIAHSIAKTAMHQLAKYLSVMLCPDIRVNVVAPGMFETSRHDIRYTKDEQALIKQRFINSALINGTVSADGIISTILFLANNPNITGQLIPVCNGTTVHKKS
jgi:NAD(P)-dependent dehydrogenase (short-subunit alcohol dehydrogenase family)